VKAIYFDFDRYDIRPGDAKTLEADAAWLKTHDVLILIEDSATSAAPPNTTSRSGIGVPGRP